MAFIPGHTVVYHNALGFEVGCLWLGFLGIGVRTVAHGAEFRQGAKLNGEANSVTLRVILLHRFNHVGEDGLVFAGYQVGHGGATDRVERGADNVGPRRTDPFDSAVQVQVHDDVEGLLGGLA